MCRWIPAVTDQKSLKLNYCDTTTIKNQQLHFYCIYFFVSLPAVIWIYREICVYIWCLLLIFKQLFDCKFTLFMAGLNTQSWRVPFPSSHTIHFTFHLWLLIHSSVSQSEASIPACDDRLASRTEAASSCGFVKNTNPLSVQLCQGFRIRDCTQRWLCIPGAFYNFH